MYKKYFNLKYIFLNKNHNILNNIKNEFSLKTAIFIHNLI